jgi:hypothetical protein
VILVHRAPAKRLMKARPRPKRLACVVEFLDGKLAVHRAMSAALAAYEARNPPAICRHPNTRAGLRIAP